MWEWTLKVINYGTAAVLVTRTVLCRFSQFLEQERKNETDFDKFLYYSYDRVSAASNSENVRPFQDFSRPKFEKT